MAKETTKKSQSTATDKQQAATFRKAARELGCDESEEQFQQALRTIARHKPKPRPTKGRRD